LKSLLNRSESGIKLLQEKPVISSDSSFLANINELPEGTFGKEYFKFMNRHKFDANDRSPIRFVTDPDLAYVMLRYRQVHDFLHVICGLPPNIVGEISLKWYEWEKVDFKLSNSL